MLKDYLAERNKSIYRIAKECGVPYSTLNDFVNGKVKASECKAGMIRDVAVILGMSMDRLYEMSEEDTRPVSVRTSSGVVVRISVSSKSYQIEFRHKGSEVTLRLCRICEASRKNITELAKKRAEEYIQSFS